MKNILTNIFALVVVTALALGGIVWVTGADQVKWPTFPPVPADAATTPQVVTEVERDFAWRIGDVIPIKIFVKQQPGTVVDLSTLPAVEGDFGFYENPEFVTRDLKDGSKLICIKIKAQSMSNAKQLSLKLSMIYRDLAKKGEEKVLTIPTFQPSTSPTWDGKDIIKDGSPTYVHEDHLYWTAGYILVGIAGAIFLFILRKRYIEKVIAEERKEWETRRETARREFDEAWAQILLGDYSDEVFKAVQRSVRKLFRIEAKTLKEADFELGTSHPYREQTLKILELTSKRLYRKNRPLKPAELLLIKAKFDEIVPPRPKVQAPAATVETEEGDQSGDSE